MSIPISVLMAVMAWLLGLVFKFAVPAGEPPWQLNVRGLCRASRRRAVMTVTRRKKFSAAVVVRLRRMWFPSGKTILQKVSSAMPDRMFRP